MKRNLSVLAMAAVGLLLAADTASAWGWKPGLFGHGRYRHVNVCVQLPYNAFTPFTGGHTYSYGTGCGGCGPTCGPNYPMHGGHGHAWCPPAPWNHIHGHHGAPYAMAPMMDPSAMAYGMPMQMPVMQTPMQMPMPQNMSYYPGYPNFATQPAAFMPASYNEQLPMRNAFQN